MHGRCENDPFDVAVNVCSSCYGEYCQDCIMDSARRKVLCRECALTIAGVRVGKVEPKGDKKTVRARRKALVDEAARRGPVRLGYGAASTSANLRPPRADGEQTTPPLIATPSPNQPDGKPTGPGPADTTNPLAPLERLSDLATTFDSEPTELDEGAPTSTVLEQPELPANAASSHEPPTGVTEPTDRPEPTEPVEPAEPAETGVSALARHLAAKREARAVKS